MDSIINAKLGWNSVGTPVSDQFDDVYFSNVSGLDESRYVFLENNHLPERWHSYDTRRFVIAETGFGTGLNFLAAWQCFDTFRQQNPDSRVKELHFISFEKYPLSHDDLIKAHTAWPELKAYADQLAAHYPIALPGCQRLVLADGAVTLDLWFGDIEGCLPEVPTNSQGLVDAWFLDGFAPSKNPDMWNANVFNGMAKLAKQGCTCATFTAAGFVRRGLIDAGFSMHKVAGFATKREMICGVLEVRNKQSNMLPWYARPTNEPIEELAIIGGGIASASLALALCRRGVKVTLYCADKQAAQNASSNRQGAIYPLLSGQHTPASQIFSSAFLYTRQAINQLAEKFSFDHEWCGVTQLAWNDKAADKLANTLTGNFPDSLLTPLTSEQTEQAIGLASDLASVSYPLGGWLNPQQFTQNLLHYLVNQFGLTIQYSTEVSQVKRLAGDNSWQLTVSSPTEHEQIRQHQAVVIANGYRFDQFEQTAQIPATAVKGQVSHVPTTDSLAKLKTVLCYNGYMTPQNPANGHHCMGASHDRQNINQAFDADAQVDNRYKLVRSLPNQAWPEEVDVSGNLSRQGIRSVTRDHLPFVGQVCDLELIKTQYAHLKQQQDEAPPVASYPNLFCLLALGGRGLCSAPLMGELLASQICNHPLPLSVRLLESIHPAKIWVRKLLKGRPVQRENPQ
jgi:tRNA 5-methylaminomethyl-2-thiouridine biosynthesis bifunctional protein